MCKKCIENGLVTKCSACIVMFKKMEKMLSVDEKNNVSLLSKKEL